VVCGKGTGRPGLRWHVPVRRHLRLITIPQQCGQHDLPETRPAREGVLNFNMAVAESETWN
jgi:hypothetical protein